MSRRRVGLVSRPELSENRRLAELAPSPSTLGSDLGGQVGEAPGVALTLVLHIVVEDHVGLHRGQRQLLDPGHHFPQLVFGVLFGAAAVWLARRGLRVHREVKRNGSTTS